MGNVAFFQGVKAPSTIFFPLAQKFLSLKSVGWFQAEVLHVLAVNAENVPRKIFDDAILFALGAFIKERLKTTH